MADIQEPVYPPAMCQGCLVAEDSQLGKAGSLCVWPRSLLAWEFCAAVTVTKMAFVTISSLSMLAGCSPDLLLGSVLSIRVR